MTGRSKWTLLGKLVLFCLLLPHAHTEDEPSAEEPEHEEPQQPPQPPPNPPPEKKESAEISKSAESAESKNSDEQDKEEAEKELGDGLPFSKGTSKHFKNITGYSYGFSTSEGNEDSWKNYGYPYANPGQFQAPNFGNQGAYYGGAAPGGYVQPDYTQNGQPFGQGSFGQTDFGQGSFGQPDYGQAQIGQWQPGQYQYNQNEVPDQMANAGAMINGNPAFQMINQYNGPNSANMNTGNGQPPSFESSLQFSNLPPGENPFLGSLSTINGGPSPGANPYFHSVQTFRAESIGAPGETSIVRQPLLQQGLAAKPAGLNMFTSNMFSRTSRGK